MTDSSRILLAFVDAQADANDPPAPTEAHALLTHEDDVELLEASWSWFGNVCCGVHLSFGTADAAATAVLPELSQMMAGENTIFVLLFVLISGFGQSASGQMIESKHVSV